MTAYSKLAKLNHLTGEYEVFFPLRAMGLAYELGHKLALGKKGVLALTWEDLRMGWIAGCASSTGRPPVRPPIRPSVRPFFFFFLPFASSLIFC